MSSAWNVSWAKWFLLTNIGKKDENLWKITHFKKNYWRQIHPDRNTPDRVSEYREVACPKRCANKFLKIWIPSLQIAFFLKKEGRKSSYTAILKFSWLIWKNLDVKSHLTFGRPAHWAVRMNPGSIHRPQALGSMGAEMPKIDDCNINGPAPPPWYFLRHGKSDQIIPLRFPSFFWGVRLCGVRTRGYFYKAHVLTVGMYLSKRWCAVGDFFSVMFNSVQSIYWLKTEPSRTIEWSTKSHQSQPNTHSQTEPIATTPHHHHTQPHTPPQPTPRSPTKTQTPPHTALNTLASLS